MAKRRGMVLHKHALQPQTRREWIRARKLSQRTSHHRTIRQLACQGERKASDGKPTLKSAQSEQLPGCHTRRSPRPEASEHGNLIFQPGTGTAARSFPARNCQKAAWNPPQRIAQHAGRDTNKLRGGAVRPRAGQLANPGRRNSGRIRDDRNKLEHREGDVSDLGEAIRPIKRQQIRSIDTQRDRGNQPAKA